ncbi:DsrE family protein [Acidianus brierleyi]|uniref:Sulfur reductase DrsE n=1 Tax=Acidianus brierleyi TaxID=41673 RepID=A0A2U9IDZ8_9CREN|nr:DsrE family protein [Acidianus brierleyi]AWR94196.1 sulfur reductase DrsE [Acidianus brierleyi]
MKVVVQVSDNSRALQAMKSVLNLRNDIKDAEIEVVFHQDAIRSLIKGNENENTINELFKNNVAVVGCRNSMTALGIKDEQLIEGIKIVTAGVGEIVRKQSEGWIYLRL